MSYPRETSELLEVFVYVDDVRVLNGFDVCVTKNGERPAEWTTPQLADGKPVVPVHGLTPGFWRVWARVHTQSETPVVDCGYFSVT